MLSKLSLAPRSALILRMPFVQGLSGVFRRLRRLGCRLAQATIKSLVS